MQSLWDRFDYVGVVCYTGYKDRIAPLKAELARVGLLDRAAFHWDFPDMFRDRMAGTLPLLKDDNRRSFPISYNNYRAMKTAYHLGCKNCLIMEDDIRFLKNLGEIEAAIRLMPEDFDLAMLDKNYMCGDLKRFLGNRKSVMVNRAWRVFDTFCSSGCYAMSRRGMERWIAAFEGGAEAVEKGMKNVDEYFNRADMGSDARLYAAQPSLAVQTVSGLHGLDEYWRLNEKSGTHRKDYAP